MIHTLERFDYGPGTFSPPSSLPNFMCTKIVPDCCLKLFTGNKDQHSIMTNSLSIPPVARFVRFIPEGFVGGPCLRVGVYVKLLRGNEQSAQLSVL